MATQSLSPEMTSYARLCLAIIDVCTKCFREVLLCSVKDKDVKKAMENRWGPHYNSSMLKKYPFSKIFQNHQLDPNFSVSDCDMSLLYSLIRNVSSVQQPLLGWGQSCWNNPQDTSIGANVERLHELRNTVIHLQEPRLSKQEFISYWNKLRDCVAVIDTFLRCTTYQQTLECLEKADMVPDFANRLIESFRANMQDLQAGQHEQGRMLSDVSEVLNQGFHELTVKSEEHRTHLAEVKYFLKDDIAKNVNDMKDSMKEMLKQMKGTAKENDQIQWLNSDQDIRTANSTSNQDDHESEISLEKHDSRDSENSTDCNKNRVEKTDVDESRRSESRAVQIHEVLVKANQDTDGGIEIGDLATGQDGKLCITKQYAFIKSNLTRENGLEIAKCLLDQTLLSQDAYDQMGNTSCARRHLIDMLLKKVIHGGKDEIVEAFFKRLIIECQSVARAVKETTITDNDRLRDAQLEARGIEPRYRLGIMRSGKSKRDVTFFKYHLCASVEVVEHIADVMLSRLHFSILDHCRILDCPRSEEMISVLFKTMQLNKLDVVSELKGVVESSLYQKWMESRSTKGSQLVSRLIRWIQKSKPVIDDSFKSEEIELKKVERGSIILRFMAGVNFSVDLLKPESLKKKIKTLLERGCLESKIEPKSVAHITVYIESPLNEGQEEIHFYIDFHATDVSIEAEDHQAEMRIRNRDMMLEEMNPIRLKQWIFDQPCIQKSHRDMLECKLSEQGLLRREEMTVLLDFINGLENGDHLLEKYCETNDLYVYNKVYRKHQESHSQPEEISGHRAAVTYVKGGGLQELFSFSIIFNDEGIDPDTNKALFRMYEDPLQEMKDIHMDTEDDIETDTDTEEDIIDPDKEEAGQHEQGRKLSDVSEVLNQGFHELTVKSEVHHTHLAEVKYLVKDDISKDVKDMKDSFKEMLEQMKSTDVDPDAEEGILLKRRETIKSYLSGFVQYTKDEVRHLKDEVQHLKVIVRHLEGILLKGREKRKSYLSDQVRHLEDDVRYVEDIVPETKKDEVPFIEDKVRDLEDKVRDLEDIVPETEEDDVRYVEDDVRYVEDEVRYVEGQVRRFEGKVRRLEGKVPCLEGKVRRLEDEVRYVEGEFRHLEGIFLKRREKRKSYLSDEVRYVEDKVRDLEDKVRDLEDIVPETEEVNVRRLEVKVRHLEDEVRHHYVKVQHLEDIVPETEKGILLKGREKRKSYLSDKVRYLEVKVRYLEVKVRYLEVKVRYLEDLKHTIVPRTTTLGRTSHITKDIVPETEKGLIKDQLTSCDKVLSSENN